MIMDIINAVCDKLAGVYIDNPIYITDSQEFKRPSFYVYTNLSNKTPANNFINKNNIDINIMYFAPLDDYNTPDIENGFIVLEQLDNLFLDNKLKVNDRYLTITKSTSGNYKNEIYYQITLEYYTDKPKETVEYSTIKDIKLKYK